MLVSTITMILDTPYLRKEESKGNNNGRSGWREKGAERHGDGKPPTRYQVHTRKHQGNMIWAY